MIASHGGGSKNDKKAPGKSVQYVFARVFAPVNPERDLIRFPKKAQEAFYECLV